MKIFGIYEFLAVFFCLSIFNNSRTMDRRQTPDGIRQAYNIVILDGPTCSGKSSLAKCFMDIVKKKRLGNWVYLQ